MLEEIMTVFKYTGEGGVYMIFCAKTNGQAWKIVIETILLKKGRLFPQLQWRETPEFWSV